MSAGAALSEPIDVVYTWVDDAFSGYREQLQGYAQKTRDTDANRTRDNLDLIKYSLRSIVAYAPFIRHVYIVSCRPQVPHWLAPSTPGLSIVHHDAFMEAGILPTFNSFAIVSFLSRVPGLSRRFFYFEDDMFLGSPVEMSDFVDEQGRLRMFRYAYATHGAEKRDRDGMSPWASTLAQTNHLLDAAFGRSKRHEMRHLPLLIDRDWWDEMLARWAEDIERTRSSRFRSKYNVAPEYLYPHFLYHTGRARPEPLLRSYTRTYPTSLENSLARMRMRLAVIRRLRPKTFNLNDSFGNEPLSSVVNLARFFLDQTFPRKSPFEM